MCRWNHLRNQRGTALVIALLIMVTATVVALCANFTSTTEITISGNQRRYCESFFRADGGLELIKSYFLDNFIFPVDVGDVTTADDLDSIGKAEFEKLDLDTSQTDVRKVLEGNPPKGRGISVQYFKGNYYRATAAAQSSVDLEEEFCLISPK
jgi:hypothetical protein